MIVVAFDEGPGIGLGHRRRAESLQRALAALGVDAKMRTIGDGVVEADVVVVDSYRVRADDRDRIRAALVVAVDDIARDLAVDVAVDPNPGASEATHHQARRVLAGAAYALVDENLRSFAVMPPRRKVGRVLVTTGATDADGIGAGLASELAGALPDARVRLVVGRWGRADVDERVELLVAPPVLSAELAAADLVVTAGGVTMLEACCLGRPTVAFSIADNQDRPLRGAAAAGAVVAADRATAAAVASGLALDYDARRELSMTARSVVDGLGASRVASVIESIARVRS